MTYASPVMSLPDNDISTPLLVMFSIYDVQSARWAYFNAITCPMFLLPIINGFQGCTRGSNISHPQGVFLLWLDKGGDLPDPFSGDQAYDPHIFHGELSRGKGFQFCRRVPHCRCSEHCERNKWLKERKNYHIENKNIAFYNDHILLFKKNLESVWFKWCTVKIKIFFEI